MQNPLPQESGQYVSLDIVGVGTGDVVGGKILVVNAMELERDSLNVFAEGVRRSEMDSDTTAEKVKELLYDPCVSDSVMVQDSDEVIELVMDWDSVTLLEGLEEADSDSVRD